MIKSAFVLLVLLSLSTVARAQKSQPNNDVCLEKEISDNTRPIFAEGGRMKIGFLVEHIAWSDEYRRAAADVIQDQFSNNFVVAGDQTLGVLVLYISGTSVVSNGAQYVSVRLQIDSSEPLLPENGDSFNDLHLAKISDPIRVMRGELVFAEDGVLLPPIEKGTPFELWQAVRIQAIREKVHDVLSEFVADWEKAGKR